MDMRSQLLIPITQRLTSIFPPGGSLPEDVWQKRYSVLLGLTWFHAAIIALVGPLLAYSWEIGAKALFHDGTVLHMILEGAIVGFFAGLGSLRRVGRTLQATAIAMGLMSSSAVLVHLSGGYIEFHFHFFVMVGLLALYQEWAPFLFAIGFVLLHHGVVGVLDLSAVYNHPAAIAHPWRWAGIHALFIAAMSVVSLITWRVNEIGRAHV